MKSCFNCEKESNFVEDYSRGEVICTDCGAVQPGRIIDEGTEYRVFGDSDNSRVRVSVCDKFLSLRSTLTSIGTENGSNNKLSKMQLSLQSKSQTLRDKHLKEGFRKIDFFCCKMDLHNSFSDRAKYILSEFLKIYKKDKSKEKSEDDVIRIHGVYSDELIFAILLMISSANKSGIMVSDFYEYTQDRKKIEKFQKKLRQCFTKDYPKSEPSDYTTRFRSELQLPFKVEAVTNKISEHSYKLERCPKSTTICAVSMYIACQICGVDLELELLCALSAVSESTVKSVSTKLKKVLPPELFEVDRSEHAKKRTRKDFRGPVSQALSNASSQSLTPYKKCKKS